MARRNCYRCPKNMAHQCNLDFGLDGCPPCADNVESAPSASHNMPRDEIRLLAESILTCLADGQVDNAKILAESIIAELSPVG
jgi:hypothetical protein